jgi:hypothetical protein
MVSRRILPVVLILMPVAEFRLKVKMVGYELNLDFSVDVNHILDRRLGIATAIHCAGHQFTEPAA